VDSSGDVTMLRDGAKLVAELSGSTWQSRYANEGDSLCSWLLSDDQGGTLRFPSFDLLGTVQSFIGADQSIIGTNLFEAYGTRPSAATGSVGGPYGYVGALGYHNDPDFDALLLSIRHYRPRLGAFVSRDRVRTEPAYGYVRGIPCVVDDASGAAPFGCIVIMSVVMPMWPLWLESTVGTAEWVEPWKIVHKMLIPWAPRYDGSGGVRGPLAVRVPTRGIPLHHARPVQGPPYSVRVRGADGAAVCRVRHGSAGSGVHEAQWLGSDGVAEGFHHNGTDGVREDGEVHARDVLAAAAAR